MPLNPGTTLGPYEIQSPLGAGGMGEVCPVAGREAGIEAVAKGWIGKVARYS